MRGARVRGSLRLAKDVLHGFVLKKLLRAWVFDGRLIAGRSVIIVGPAAGVEVELRDFQIDDYDVVVRMNRGVHLAVDPANGVGTRTDILFHNFKEKGERSAGRLSEALLLEQNVKVVLYTHTGHNYVPYIVRAMIRFWRTGSAAEFRLVDPDLYTSVSTAVGRFAPLTGTVALALIVACRPKRLGVVGFSFFQTQYHKAYHGTLRSDMAPLDWARGGGSHEPTQDRDFIRSLLSSAARDGLEVHLGHNVARHLDLPVDARPAYSAQRLPVK